MAWAAGGLREIARFFPETRVEVVAFLTAVERPVGAAVTFMVLCVVTASKFLVRDKSAEL